MAGCAGGIAVLMPRLPWLAWDDVVDRLPLVGQLAVLALAVVVYYVAPLPVAIVSALVFAAVAVARLDLALLFVALTAPFYLYPRPIGGQVFSLPEVLTLLCFGAWLVRGPGQRQWRVDGAFRWPALFLVFAAIVSLGATIDLRLSLRELRTVVIEPVLFYIMAVSAFGRTPRQPAPADAGLGAGAGGDGRSRGGGAYSMSPATSLQPKGCCAPLVPTARPTTLAC